VETRGFDSLAVGEHTHIPVDAEAPAPPEMLRTFASQFDPYVALAAAAAVTRRIAVGTCVTVVPEHNPLGMAKAVASLDRLSGGRVFLGIGAGWSKEVEAHGVAFNDRWPATREYVLAMREIWRNEEPEFHGQFVDFGKSWSFPKPTTPEGPPILLGSQSRWSAGRVVDYCDGWLPNDRGDDVELGIELLRAACDEEGRAFDSLRIEVYLPEPTEKRLAELMKLGVHRVHLALPVQAKQQLPALDQYAELVSPLR
jgi:probable F420-dependent oxidoreductase